MTHNCNEWVRFQADLKEIVTDLIRHSAIQHLSLKRKLELFRKKRTSPNLSLTAAEW